MLTQQTTKIAVKEPACKIGSKLQMPYHAMIINFNFILKKDMKSYHSMKFDQKKISFYEKIRLQPQYYVAHAIQYLHIYMSTY